MRSIKILECYYIRSVTILEPFHNDIFRTVPIFGSQFVYNKFWDSVLKYLRNTVTAQFWN